jgi:CubicO group peptidase (beta-lactamase class C family)
MALMNLTGRQPSSLAIQLERKPVRADKGGVKLLRLAILLLFGFLPLISSANQEVADAFTPAEVAGVRAFLDRSMTNGNAGMVIGLLDRQGSRVLSAGKLDNGTDDDVDGNTIFGLGSITKVFTSLLAIDAERRGEMKLADRVKQYLPDGVTVPSAGGREITIGNLARQDSGLPWHPNNYSVKNLMAIPRAEMKKLCDQYSVANLYDFLKHYTLTNVPGAGFHYSNTGMALLGHAIERRTGKGFETLVVDRICRPLGMTSTGIGLAKVQTNRLAIGHFQDGTKGENLAFQAMEPAGSLLSTVNDMLKFLAAVTGLEKSGLAPTFAQMQVIQHEDSARFGRTATPWMNQRVYNPPGSTLLGHGGGGFGYLAFIGFDVGKQRAIAVLSNQMVHNPSPIGWAVLQGLPLTSFNTRFPIREVVGAGVALNNINAEGELRIKMVFPSSPADLAGITPGQVLIAIDGMKTEGKELSECLGRMGGKADTKLVLVVRDPGGTEPRTVELSRARFVAATRE